MEQYIAKRGRAYRCLGCTSYIGEKRYVTSHYYKYHLPLDRVPFYCSLCHFICAEEGKLKEHVAKYSKHLEAVDCLKKSGKEPNESTYLNRNYNPVTVQEGHHYVKLSRVESRMVWIERYREEKKEDRKPVPAILAIPEENKACTVSTELEYEYDDILDYLLGTEPSVDSNNNVATCTSAKGEGKLEAQSQEKDDGDVDRKVDDRTVDERTVEKEKDDERTVEKRKVDDRKVVREEE